MARKWTDKNGIRHFDDSGPRRVGKPRTKRCGDCDDGLRRDPIDGWIYKCPSCNGRGRVRVMRLMNGDDVAAGER